MLSADVNAAVDPNFESAMKKKCYLFEQRCYFTKYTGSRKYDASDANAEFVGEVRKLFMITIYGRQASLER